MKTIIAAMTLAAILLTGCKATETLSKDEKLAELTEKIESGNFVFLAQRANTTKGSVYINSSFALTISKDTIDANLPYYGRAYVSPVSTNEGGIKFISTDFEYVYSEKGKKEWNISIVPNDNQKRYKLSLNVMKGGNNATLTVMDVNRQSISFYGLIE